jgi:hypothetical protein
MQEVVRMSGTNGFKLSPTVQSVFSSISRGEEPVGTMQGDIEEGLWERCRARRAQGMDTSQVERFITEGQLAESQGRSLYAQLMFQIAYESLQ